jgi:hypothetical protein
MKRPVGRPKSTEETEVINIRVPKKLIEKLDRYIDKLEVAHGLRANRTSVARRALEIFLQSVMQDDM